MSNAKVKKLFIEQFKGFRNFNISFEDDVNVLVGENGTGKTTLFEIIYNGLSGNKDYFKDESLTKIEIIVHLDGNDRTISIINDNEKIRLLIDNTETDSGNDFFEKQKVLYFPADLAFRPYIVNGPTRMEEEEKDIKLNSDKISKDLKQYIVNSRFLDLNDKDENKEGNRIGHLKTIFNSFFDDKEFVNIDAMTFEPTFRLKETNEIITLDELSLWEKQIFYKGCSLVQYTENKGIIILVDEPEASLHPEWQQKILDLYKNINHNNQYLFATHSPHIVSCCGKEKIRLIEKEENILRLREDIGETYGATNEDLLYDVFNLNSVRNIEVQENIDRYRDLYYRRDFISAEEREELEQLREKLLAMKSLPKDFIPLLELEVSTQKLSEI